MTKQSTFVALVVALVATGAYFASRDPGSLTQVPAPPAPGANDADRETFAQAMAAAVRASTPTAKVELDAARYVLLWEDGELRGEFHLARSFDEYARLLPVERDEYVRMRADAIVSPSLPAKFAEAEPKIVPVVRPRIDYEIARIAASTDPMRDMPPEPPHVALTDDLWGVLAFETDEQFVRLDGKALEAWNVTFEDAWRGALARLEDRSARVTLASNDGVHELRARDGNDSARLLVPSVLAKIPVGGDAVIAAPRPDLVLAADARSPSALRALADRLVEGWDSGGTNVRLLRAREGALSPFTVDREHPLHAQLADLIASANQRDEQLQRTALRARYGEEEGAPFVASVLRMRDPLGSELEFVVHSEDVDTLLPRAEWVVFRRVDLGKKTATTLACGRWDDVFAMMQGRWKATPFHPARWRATALPTPKELAQLGCSHPGLRMDMNVARPIR